MHKNYFIENNIVHVRQEDGSYIKKEKVEDIEKLLICENTIEECNGMLHEVDEKMKSSNKKILNFRNNIYLCLFFSFLVEIEDFLLIGLKSGYGLNVIKVIQFFSKPLFINGILVFSIFGGLILKNFISLKKVRKENRVLTSLKRRIEKNLFDEKKKQHYLATKRSFQLNQEIYETKTIDDTKERTHLKERMKAYYCCLLYQKAYLKQLKLGKEIFIPNLDENPVENSIILEMLDEFKLH